MNAHTNDPARPVTLTGAPEPAAGTIDWQPDTAYNLATHRLGLVLNTEQRRRDEARCKHDAERVRLQREEAVAGHRANLEAAKAARRFEAAKAAMQGLVGDAEFTGPGWESDVAKAAVAVADALLLELAKPVGGAK